MSHEYCLGLGGITERPTLLLLCCAGEGTMELMDIASAPPPAHLPGFHIK